MSVVDWDPFQKTSYKMADNDWESWFESRGQCKFHWLSFQTMNDLRSTVTVDLRCLRNVWLIFMTKMWGIFTTVSVSTSVVAWSNNLFACIVVRAVIGADILTCLIFVKCDDPASCVKPALLRERQNSWPWSPCVYICCRWKGIPGQTDND